MIGSIHRTLLRIAHTVRHRWRMIRRARLRGVSMIARNPKGEILLVRHSYGPPGWYLPGGGIGWREQPRDAALRELAEETACLGFDVRKLGEMEETLSGSPHTAHVYTCVVDDMPRVASPEIERVAFFALENLPVDITPRASARLALIDA